MTKQEIDQIESAIRHIQTTTDINPWVVWAVEIAVEAMKKQIPQNCHDMSICCEDETGLCDYFEEMEREGINDDA